ncbi:melatonin receptor type 1A-like isoform X1 [Ciona intestinalis]
MATYTTQPSYINETNVTTYGYNVTSTMNFTETTYSYSLAYKVGVSFVLTLIAVVGTLGNICIIYAVCTQKKLRRLKTNYFVCNLALADLTVTSVVIPSTVANVINNNVSPLPVGACMFVGFIMPLSCVASMQNLMLISTQRLSATEVTDSNRNTSEAIKTWALVVFAWVWSTMLVLPLTTSFPTLTNTTATNMLKYDAAAGMCAWDDVSSPRYNFALICVAFCIPLIVSGICYTVLFKRVKGKSRKMTNQMETKNVTLVQRERRLLKTILIVLVVFVVSWGPYCLIVLLSTFGISDFTTNETWKRTTAWLGVSNSAFNSIIYGWRNQNFRIGYKMCFYQVVDGLTCNKYGMRRRVLRRSSKRKRQRMSDLAHRTVPNNLSECSTTNKYVTRLNNSSVRSKISLSVNST